MSDCRNRQIDASVVDSAINRGLVDVNFKRVDKMSLVQAMSLARRLVLCPKCLLHLVGCYAIILVDINEKCCQLP